MRRSGRRGLAVLASLLVLFLSFTAQAQTAAHPGLALEGELSLAGSGEQTAAGGALYYHGSERPSDLELHADHITLEYAWKEGQAVGTPWQDNFQETTTEQDRTSMGFSNVTVDVDAFSGQPELLAYPGHGGLLITATGTGDQSYEDLDAPFLTRVGKSPKTGSTNDSQSIGFWYEPNPSWVAGARSDEATVEGDFSLFLNNLTVTVHQDGETVWQNWTGYREEDTGPTASSYERHLLKLHVTNGTLRLAEEDAVSVLGPVLDVNATGVVTAQEATGRLSLDDVAFAFEDEPVRLEGEGAFRVTETQASAPGGISLDVGEGSQFDVEGGQRVDTGLHILADEAGWQLWIPGSLFALLLAGAVAHKTGYTHKAVTRWRSERYSKWMTRGRELANGGDYSGAVPCFERATQAQPVKGVAWYHLTVALLEDGRPREVLEVIDEARAGEAVIDDLDFLELEAAAANQVGQRERCRAAVAQLASGSEAMARSLAHDLGLGEQVLGPELATRLSPGDEDEELPGYV